LDRPCDGQGDRHFAALGATHLAGLSVAAASDPRDPSFATKLADIVGLYVDPLAHAVALSLDEKSQTKHRSRNASRLFEN
jgi:hypothetical protein